MVEITIELRACQIKYTPYKSCRFSCFILFDKWLIHHFRQLKNKTYFILIAFISQIINLFWDSLYSIISSRKHIYKYLLVDLKIEIN